MSTQTKEAFDKVWQEMLEESHNCGYCGKDCIDANRLVLHIWDKHNRKNILDSTYNALLKCINQPE
jgi:hypothetical protein